MLGSDSHGGSGGGGNGGSTETGADAMLGGLESFSVLDMTQLSVPLPNPTGSTSTSAATSSSSSSISAGDLGSTSTSTSTSTPSSSLTASPGLPGLPVIAFPPHAATPIPTASAGTFSLLPFL